MSWWTISLSRFTLDLVKNYPLNYAFITKAIISYRAAGVLPEGASVHLTVPTGSQQNSCTNRGGSAKSQRPQPSQVPRSYYAQCKWTHNEYKKPTWPGWVTWAQGSESLFLLLAFLALGICWCPCLKPTPPVSLLSQGAGAVSAQLHPVRLFCGCAQQQCLVALAQARCNKAEHHKENPSVLST